MLTVKATSVSLLVLLLAMVLIAIAVFYWHHITGASLVHLLGFTPKPGIGQGC